MEQQEYDTSLKDIINTYNAVVKVIDTEAKDNTEDRAYGGMVRAVKGKLQEHITHSLIMIAWKELGGADSRIAIDRKKVKVPMKKEYLKKIRDKNVRLYIKENIDDYFCRISVDKHVYIDNTFVMGIECKSFTENAMLKRIMVDFDLIRTIHKNITCYLIQLESQLTGDYSELNKITYGSASTHSIMSYFDTRLNILTLLKGERSITKPIHTFYKKLKVQHLENVKNILKSDLKRYI